MAHRPSALIVCDLLRKLLASPLSHLQAFDKQFAIALRTSLLHEQGPGAGDPEPEWLSTLVDVSGIHPEWLASEEKHMFGTDDEFYGFGHMSVEKDICDDHAKKNAIAENNNVESKNISNISLQRNVTV